MSAQTLISVELDESEVRLLRNNHKRAVEMYQRLVRKYSDTQYPHTAEDNRNTLQFHEVRLQRYENLLKAFKQLDREDDRMRRVNSQHQAFTLGTLDKEALTEEEWKLVIRLRNADYGTYSDEDMARIDSIYRNFTKREGIAS